MLGDRPAGLARWLELLQRCPLVAMVRPDRIVLRAVMAAADGRLIERYDWPVLHWDLWTEACDLFWTDVEVWDWCCNHPHAEDGIHYRNVHATDWTPGQPVVGLPLAGETSSVT